jgi:hypothetical protein
MKVLLILKLSQFLISFYKVKFKFNEQILKMIQLYNQTIFLSFINIFSNWMHY